MEPSSTEGGAEEKLVRSLVSAEIILFFFSLWLMSVFDEPQSYHPRSHPPVAADSYKGLSLANDVSRGSSGICVSWPLDAETQ